MSYTLGRPALPFRTRPVATLVALVALFGAGAAQAQLANGTQLTLQRQINGFNVGYTGLTVSDSTPEYSLGQANGNELSFDFSPGGALTVALNPGSGGFYSTSVQSFGFWLPLGQLEWTGVTKISDTFPSLQPTGSSGWSATLNPNQPALLTLTLGEYGSVMAPASAQAVFEFGVGTVAAVPEPGSWALMLAGIAGVAGLMRRRAAHC